MNFACSTGYAPPRGSLPKNSIDALGGRPILFDFLSSTTTAGGPSEVDVVGVGPTNLYWTGALSAEVGDEFALDKGRCFNGSKWCLL